MCIIIEKDFIIEKQLVLFLNVLCYYYRFQMNINVFS